MGTRASDPVLETAPAQGHIAPISDSQPQHRSIYLQGIDTEELIATVHARRAR